MPLNDNQQAWLDETFVYHAPTPEDAQRYKAIRETAKTFAKVILTVCPDSPDRSVALRRVREAVMSANSSIALKDAPVRP